MWIKFSGSYNSSDWSDIFGLTLTDGSRTEIFRAETYGSGTSWAIFCNNLSGVTGGSASFGLEKDQWKHLVIVKSGKNVTSYINGLHSTRTVWDGLPDVWATGDFYIG